MIWQNPWAWLGMLALAVPILIHLLGRRSARITRFPTLRFVRVSRLMATTRARLSDHGLLAVRMGIIAAAVMALAMPLLLTAERQRERGRSVARAIVIDTSESMRRVTRDGTSRALAVDVARSTGQRLAGEAGTSVTIHTAAPSAAIQGALGWLTTQRGRREIIIISDFQVGSVDSIDVAAVASDVGIGLTRIEVEEQSVPIEATTHQGGVSMVTRVTLDSARSVVEWIPRSPAGSVAAGRDSLVILAQASERASADAALAAARSLTSAAPVAGRPIAIVYGGAARFSEVVNAATPLRQPWQGDVLVRLRNDPELRAAASAAEVQDDVTAGPGPGAPPFVSVARTAAGLTVVLATTATIDGTDRLVLLPVAPAGSLLSAAVIAAALRASSDERAIGELEPSTVPEETLALWRRAAAPDAAAAAPDDDSDGRWLWMLALILLGLETWMRRTRRVVAIQELAHERAA